MSFDNDGQRAPRAARMKLFHPRTKTRFTAKRPVDADCPTMDVTQSDGQVARDRRCVKAPLPGREFQPLVNEAQALRFAPPHDGPARQRARL
jgi:hypothetical protein